MKNKNILITGGFGFIGSNLVKFLNSKGVIPFVYDTKTGDKWKNVAGLNFHIVETVGYYDIIVHLGANVDTREKMSSELWRNNFEFSKSLFHCGKKFIYASSASVYGAEEKDFKERTFGLKPTNAYGFSKWAFDSYVENKLETHPKNKIGLRFFNVYGPNEDYKKEMASVVHKVLSKDPSIWKAIRDNGKAGVDYGICLFKSNRKDIEDGGQKRDFVYVEDVCKVIWHFIENDLDSGVYNLGSGKARSFKELAKCVAKEEDIGYVEMPSSLEKHYQYFTQADLTKLRAAGYKEEFTSLEDGIKKMIETE